MAEVSGRRRAVTVLILAAATIAVFFFAQPDWLISTSSSNDRAAQSNLTNALTEAASQYQNNGQSYSTAIVPILRASAPEFTWVVGGPSTLVGVSPNVVGIDPCADGPSCQAVLLTSYSKGTDTCWYAVEASSDQAAAALGLPSGGTFYGLRRQPQNCSTGTPGHPALPQFGWHSSYSAAGSGA